MEERTRAYLGGRFRDFYRRSPPEEPPGSIQREWGYIPWTGGPETTMVRHRSRHDMGDLQGFLVRERPRHVYFSAGYYDDPSARQMDEKGWQGSDLVFDLDADHLPEVNPAEDSYPEMLQASKDALFKLLDLLETDFGFHDLTIAFSGGRGYHVHVRDESVKQLDRPERREIVDYVRGNQTPLESLIQKRAVGGRGRKTPTSQRTIPSQGGWGRRVVSHIREFVDELLSLSEEAALSRLREFDGVGQKNAEAILNVVRENTAEVKRGNVDVHPAFLPVARAIVEKTLTEDASPIDEPVTTDTHRLIRLPGSLHGGTGLRVVPLERSEIESFDPLTDAVPETFEGHDIAIEVQDERIVELNGESLSVAPGYTTVPEYAGIFLMARGWAEKARE